MAFSMLPLNHLGDAPHTIASWAWGRFRPLAVSGGKFPANFYIKVVVINPNTGGDAGD